MDFINFLRSHRQLSRTFVQFTHGFDGVDEKIEDDLLNQRKAKYGSRRFPTEIFIFRKKMMGGGIAQDDFSPGLVHERYDVGPNITRLSAACPFRSAPAT